MPGSPEEVSRLCTDGIWRILGEVDLVDAQRRTAAFVTAGGDPATNVTPKNSRKFRDFVGAPVQATPAKAASAKRKRTSKTSGERPVKKVKLSTTPVSVETPTRGGAGRADHSVLPTVQAEVSGNDNFAAVASSPQENAHPQFNTAETAPENSFSQLDGSSSWSDPGRNGPVSEREPEAMGAAQDSEGSGIEGDLLIVQRVDTAGWGFGARGIVAQEQMGGEAGQGLASPGWNDDLEFETM